MKEPTELPIRFINILTFIHQIVDEAYSEGKEEGIIYFEDTDMSDHIADVKKKVARDIKKMCQTNIRNSDDWHAIADLIDKKYLKREDKNAN